MIGSNHYALVASIVDDGVQIIDITDPASPSAVADINKGSIYSELDDANSITTTTIQVNGRDRHYALVTSRDTNGIQMIDITDPAHPFNPLRPYVELDLAGDRRATYTGLEDGGKSLVFEYVVRGGDMTEDLAYKGTGAFKLGPNILKDADDSTDIPSVTLPDPGSAHSLSHNKDITLSDLAVGAFATTWKTTSADESITLPLVGSGMTVYWGDGNTTTASGPVSHTYNTAGDYTIQITGDLTRFHLNNAGYAPKINIDRPVG